MCARGWTLSRRPSTAIIVCGAISIRAARLRREPMQRPRGTDPFTLEIIKDTLVAIGDEMFVALQRTSKSPIIYEVLDYACGLTDARGQMLAQGQGVTGFLGTLGQAVAEVRGKFAGRLHPGDNIITNDTYGGGGTLPSDVSSNMHEVLCRQLMVYMVS